LMCINAHNGRADHVVIKKRGTTIGRCRFSLILNYETRSVVTMKMKATIEVEFEAKDGQTRNILESALVRGVGALCVAIEYGSLTGAPSGVKSGSVFASIQKREVSD
jgi:hypothetical protein